LKTYKLGVTGTHHTGKSTFLTALAEKLTERGISVARVADLATEAKSKGFPILREHNYRSTAWIICRGITLELEAAQKAAVILVDRPVVDAMGYLFAALRYRNENLKESEERYLEAIVKIHCRTYDQILLSKIDSSIPIDHSKERDEDLTFRQMAEEGIVEALTRLSIPHRPLPSVHRDEVATSILDEMEGCLT
jgi:predicted ATPase